MLTINIKKGDRPLLVARTDDYQRRELWTPQTGWHEVAPNVYALAIAVGIEIGSCEFRECAWCGKRAGEDVSHSICLAHEAEMLSELQLSERKGIGCEA